MAEDELAKAAELAVPAYPNPRELTESGIAALLTDACTGRSPHRATVGR